MTSALITSSFGWEVTKCLFSDQIVRKNVPFLIEADTNLPSLPGLRIEPFGSIALPINSIQVESMTAKHLHLPSVEKDCGQPTPLQLLMKEVSMEFTASQISLTNPKWSNEIQRIHEKLINELEIPPNTTSVRLTKAVLQKSSMQSSKYRFVISPCTNDVVAKVYVQLPAEYTGGSLFMKPCTSQSDTMEEVQIFAYDPAKTPYSCHYVACKVGEEHRDCLYFKPLQEGYRILLEYEICVSHMNSTFSSPADPTDGLDSRLYHCLKSWSKDAAPMLMIPLVGETSHGCYDGAYFRQTKGIAGLNGIDLMRYRALEKVSKKLKQDKNEELKFYLVLLKKIKGSPDQEEEEECIEISDVKTAEGKMLTRYTVSPYHKLFDAAKIMLPLLQPDHNSPPIPEEDNPFHLEDLERIEPEVKRDAKSNKEEENQVVEMDLSSFNTEKIQQMMWGDEGATGSSQYGWFLCFLPTRNIHKARIIFFGFESEITSVLSINVHEVQQHKDRLDVLLDFYKQFKIHTSKRSSDSKSGLNLLIQLTYFVLHLQDKRRVLILLSLILEDIYESNMRSKEVQQHEAKDLILTKAQAFHISLASAYIKQNLQYMNRVQKMFEYTFQLQFLSTSQDFQQIFVLVKALEAQKGSVTCHQALLHLSNTVYTKWSCELMEKDSSYQSWSLVEGLVQVILHKIAFVKSVPLVLLEYFLVHLYWKNDPMLKRLFLEHFFKYRVLHKLFAQSFILYSFLSDYTQTVAEEEDDTEIELKKKVLEIFTKINDPPKDRILLNTPLSIHNKEEAVNSEPVVTSVSSTVSASTSTCTMNRVTLLHQQEDSDEDTEEEKEEEGKEEEDEKEGDRLRKRRRRDERPDSPVIISLLDDTEDEEEDHEKKEEEIIIKV